MTSIRWILPVLLLSFFVAIGCGPTGETVVVTDRPETPESTEGEPTDAIPMLTESVETGDFDLGKLWRFNDLPLDYLRDEYGLSFDEAWVRQARQAGLRFSTYCSASFVSPNGLIMTNHHCGRESIVEVSEENENLLADGFYASHVDEERRVPDLHVDEMVRVEDVTEDVYEALEGVRTGQTEVPARIRQQRANTLQGQLSSEARERDTTLHVEVVELNGGAQYSAYTFRRHDDVRLVMAPEMQVSFFGGGSDNFTYPRYALDVAFFRAYDQNGDVVEPTSHFRWSPDGAEEGDAVFVVGSPGGTQRHLTASQLQYQRDRQLPRQLEAMDDRMDLIEDFFAEHETVFSPTIQNLYFSLQNSLKSTEGQLAGLQDEDLMARRASHDQELQQFIHADDDRRAEYSRILPQIESLQRSKQSVSGQLRGYTFFGSTRLEAPLLSRALYGYYLQQLRRSGATDQRLDEIRQEALDIPDWPEELQEMFVAQRLRDMREYLGPQNRTVRTLIGDRSVEEVAAELVEQSALSSADGFAQLLEEGFMQSDDPAVQIAETMASQFFEINRQLNDFQLSERNLNAQLNTLRYEMRDGLIAPDASGTPRISDGRISGYSYEGTEAPYKTTFYGLYDRTFTQDHPDWALPPRWMEPPERLDQETPLNIVSTNDIAGGHSGAPLLNEDLQVVGVVFDSNLEALSNAYLYREGEGRTISVDSRGIMAALDQVYQANRIVEELRTGRLTNDDRGTPGD